MKRAGLRRGCGQVSMTGMVTKFGVVELKCLNENRIAPSFDLGDVTLHDFFGTAIGLLETQIEQLYLRWEELDNRPLCK